MTDTAAANQWSPDRGSLPKLIGEIRAINVESRAEILVQV
jgi:hypothetical protein